MVDARTDYGVLCAFDASVLPGDVDEVIDDGPFER